MISEGEGMMIKYHSHGGYYGDGNSHYWVEDRFLDVGVGMITIKREETFGGQLAGPSQFSHSKDVKESAREAVPFADEDAIWDTLKPLIETAQKYPHRETFRFLSDKHRYFVKGRIDKAVNLAGDSDYHGVNCLKHVFVLWGVVVTVYYEDTFRHSYWKCKVEELGG